MPWTCAAITAGAAGLVGLPLTAGFVSKWLLVSGAIEAGSWLLALVMVAGALLAAGYAWRLVEPLYQADPEDAATGGAGAAAGGGSAAGAAPGAPPDLEMDGEAPWLLVLPTWVLVGGSLLLGVAAGPAVDLARRAAETLP